MIRPLNHDEVARRCLADVCQAIRVVMRVGRTDNEQRVARKRLDLRAQGGMLDQRRQPDGVDATRRGLCRQQMSHRQRAQGFADEDNVPIRALFAQSVIGRSDVCK